MPTDLNDACELLQERFEIVAMRRSSVELSRWNRMPEDARTLLPEWWKAMHARFPLMDATLCTVLPVMDYLLLCRHFRPEDLATLVQEDPQFEILLSAGYFPFAGAENGDLWVFDSSAGPDGPVFFLELSAWDGSADGVEAALTKAADRLACLYCGMEITETDYPRHSGALPLHGKPETSSVGYRILNPAREADQEFARAELRRACLCLQGRMKILQISDEAAAPIGSGATDRPEGTSLPAWFADLFAEHPVGGVTLRTGRLEPASFWFKFITPVDLLVRLKEDDKLRRLLEHGYYAVGDGPDGILWICKSADGPASEIWYFPYASWNGELPGLERSMDFAYARLAHLLCSMEMIADDSASATGVMWSSAGNPA